MEGFFDIFDSNLTHPDLNLGKIKDLSINQDVLKP
jgi:hypothetical protein